MTQQSPFWSDLNTQLMVMAAHRYCLGRQSYIVGSAIEWLWKHHKYFDRNTLRVIVRDTVDAINDSRAGSEHIDVPGWKSLASRLFAELNNEDQQWVRRAILSCDKDWPLFEVETTKEQP